MIGKAIYDRLTTETNVAALVGTRVYPELASDQQTYPVIVYDVEDDNREDSRTLGGTSLEQFMVRIVVIARNYPDVNALAKKVKDALDDQAGTWGGIVVQGAFLEGESEECITIVDAQEERYSMKELEFLVWANT